MVILHNFTGLIQSHMVIPTRKPFDVRAASRHSGHVPLDYQHYPWFFAARD